MKLATIRLDGGHRAVRVDGDTATVLDAADVGALLAEPGWSTSAARATGPTVPVEGLDYAPLVPDRTRSSASA
jgi:acylpyruvate hydrolase